MMIYCSNCGKENPEGARFCDACGRNLHEPNIQSQHQKSEHPSYPAEKKSTNPKRIFKRGEKEPKPFEATLAILIAISAALSGMAGFLSADAKNYENLSKGLSFKEQNLANTAYLEANQIVLGDLECLREANNYEYLAGVLGDDNYQQIAYYMRNTSIIVIDGFITYEGKGADQYDGDYATALQAYFLFMYADYDLHLNNSELAAMDSQNYSKRSSDLLLTTVFMAFSSVIATVGLVAESLRIKLMMVILVLSIMALALFFVVMTITG